MTAASTPSGAPSKRPTQGRIFILARNVFALLGFGAALVVALSQAREDGLNQFDAVTWIPQVRPGAVAPTAEAAILAAESIQVAIPAADPDADPTVDRRLGAFLRTGAAAADPARPVHAVGQADATGDERAAVTQYIAKRYRVADEVIADFVDTAYRAGADYSIDPLIVLAVVATESRYNPIAESVVGAKGLMQIIAKFHPEKLVDHGGEAALFEPAVNIRIGAQILREYQRRYGNMETALQMYAGALDDTDTHYARKVFAERARLRKILARSRREA